MEVIMYSIQIILENRQFTKKREARMNIEDILDPVITF